MAGQTSPVGVNESLADAKTLWIGDLAYWCDETWLQSLFAGARAGTWAHVGPRCSPVDLLLFRGSHCLPLVGQRPVPVPSVQGLQD